jgi:purine-binding chemotaxis protein CheW
MESDPIDGADRSDDVEAPQAMFVRVGESRWAIPLGELREVLRARPVTRVPGTAGWIPGLVTIRGTLVPVADLVRRAGESGEPAWLLIVERDGRQAALGVTAVDGVQPVADEGNAPADPLLAAATLPRRGAARLLTQPSTSAAGAPTVADVLDVAALFEELFEGD